MEEFEYKVSVIVPVYNGEEYLRDCLNSLLLQTLEQKEIEVLMVNDGSTDGSMQICQEYSEIYDNFKLFTKENEGLSATRNFGLHRAKGKYIFYLDADDKYSPQTLKNVSSFFDEHYDEVDEVTFPIVRYKGTKTLPLHYRYKYLTKTGVYDLEKYPFASQTTINICVKNRKEKNILFDTTPNFRHEDQKYNNQVLMRLMRIGFVKEAEYQYNRNNEASIVSTYMYPYYCFETTMHYYEELFDQFEAVPKYYQALFIHDLNWKLCDDKLYPFHYEKDQFQRAVERIQNLLSKCGYETILKHPTMNHFHLQYWLALKPNVFPGVIAGKDSVQIVVEGRSIYERNYFEIIMHKIRVKNGRLRMLGFVKSPVYNHIKEPADVWVVENESERKKMEVFCSVHSFYKSGFTQTNYFYAFDYYCDTEKVREFYFEVELDGRLYPTKYWCMPVAVFDIKNGIDHYIRENTLLQLDGNVIRLERLGEKEIEDAEHGANQKYRKNISVYNLREYALKYRKKHAIWLYYDAYTVEKDNGFYQFINDIRHSPHDGIERYYIMTNKKSLDLFTEEQKRYVVEFGSEKHKLLYLSCKRIFTAFYGFSPVSPFGTEAEEAKYIDLIKFETIYLQHGVLHAALHTYNAVERCRAEQIVVSSQFEIENYMKNYHYKKEDLIPVGMARYDFIDRTKPPVNKILYAPSWRKYLTFSKGESNWKVVREKLVESDYFLNMISFVNDKKLEELLFQYDMYLEVKLHPIIAGDARDLLDIKSERVLVAKDEIRVEDYKMFITDFSSYVFDFACLNRPVLYYVTDYLQFKSGMNHYKELDLPFEEAFGPMVTDQRDAVDETEKILNRQFEPEKVYEERMQNFFVPLKDCREKLYRYVMLQDGEENAERN